MPAGSADLHETIAGRFGVDDDLPCADPRLLVPLKRSPEYRALRPRVAELKPTDSWQEQELHFFVFALRPTAAAEPAASENGAEPPVAVFAMHPDRPTPVSAIVVTPDAGGKEAAVTDLIRPDNKYTAPYSPRPAPKTT